ncbi:MAG: acetylglutamate kinase [Clostridia bacterium]|nr:acetylglutamate kinase [Clostridia bacterium]
MEYNYTKEDLANILVTALPYIQKLAGKTIVIKYGGNAMINEELKNSVIEDITLLKYIGANPIVVHGGGPDITAALKSYNIESKFINGLRVTDEETMRVAQMVLVGKTNKEIVSLIGKNGGNAIGICGIDGACIKCRRKTTVVDGERVDIGFVGDIVDVDEKVLNLFCKDKYIPVIAPIGMDEEGHSYNINADDVASSVAAAMGAEKLIFLTDIEGVKDKDGNVIFEMSKKKVKQLIAEGIISGGMIPKVTGCMEAIRAGVSRVHIIDGRVPHCILLEIFTDTGIGTMITN